MSVWQFFKEYEMKLISSLSMSQKEDLENDCIENQFFKFKDIYPGSNFACVGKMNKPKLPMLYYKDQIPDLEMCKIHNCEDDQIEETVQRIRNEYATICLYCSFPSKKNQIFLCLMRGVISVVALWMMKSFTMMHQESCKIFKMLKTAKKSELSQMV